MLHRHLREMVASSVHILDFRQVRISPAKANSVSDGIRERLLPEWELGVLQEKIWQQAKEIRIPQPMVPLVRIRPKRTIGNINVRPIYKKPIPTKFSSANSPAPPNPSLALR